MIVHVAERFDKCQQLYVADLALVTADWHRGMEEVAVHALGGLALIETSHLRVSLAVALVLAIDKPRYMLDNTLFGQFVPSISPDTLNEHSRPFILIPLLFGLLLHKSHDVLGYPFFWDHVSFWGRFAIVGDPQIILLIKGLQFWTLQSDTTFIMGHLF